MKVEEIVIDFVIGLKIYFSQNHDYENEIY